MIVSLISLVETGNCLIDGQLVGFDVDSNEVPVRIDILKELFLPPFFFFKSNYVCLSRCPPGFVTVSLNY